MVYGVGVAAKSSFQRSSPQNLGSKGLTGIFDSFSVFLYHIARSADEEALHFSLDFPRHFPSKNSEEWSTCRVRFSCGHGRAARDGFCAGPSIRLCAGGGEWSAKEAVSAVFASQLPLKRGGFSSRKSRLSHFWRSC
jgi:hypothetical protein